MITMKGETLQITDQEEKQLFQGRLNEYSIHKTYAGILSWVGAFESKYLLEKHVPLLDKKMNF